MLGNDDPDADYRNADGYILTGPGVPDRVQTARPARTWPPCRSRSARGNVADWGDDYGNRVDRFLATLAFLEDSGRPSLVMARGYYARTTLTAWNYRDGKLTRVWTADSDDRTRRTQGRARTRSASPTSTPTGARRSSTAPPPSTTTARACARAPGPRRRAARQRLRALAARARGVHAARGRQLGAYTMRDGKTCAMFWQGPEQRRRRRPGPRRGGRHRSEQPRRRGLDQQRGPVRRRHRAPTPARGRARCNFLSGGTATSAASCSTETA